MFIVEGEHNGKRLNQYLNHVSIRNNRLITSDNATVKLENVISVQGFSVIEP